MKGVIIAAGYGTRFLPVSRVVPKELLPLGTRPALDFIVQEFIDAGITDILVVTSARKKAIEDWFRLDEELAEVFEREGAVEKRRKIEPPAANVQFVHQQQMRGTGDAILLARDFVGDDAFVVAYPDDLFGQPNCTAQLIETWRETGACVLSAQDLTGEDVSRYGVFEFQPGATGHVRPVSGFVEKPPVGEEPSHWVSLGRYLYLAEIFPLLAAGLADAGPGEFYPMDAIVELAAQGKVMARVVDAERRDTGAPLGYLQAVIDEALGDPQLADPLRAWLSERLGG